MLSLCACSDKTEESTDNDVVGENTNTDPADNGDKTNNSGENDEKEDPAPGDGNEDKEDAKPGDGDNNNDESENESVTALVERLLKEQYKKVTVDIRTVSYGFVLNSFYEITENSVTYQIEKLNSLPSDGNISDAIMDYKQTICGTATVKNGKLVDENGNEVDLPELGNAGVSFNLDADNITVTENSEGILSGSVKSAKDFLGTSTSATDMVFCITYSADRITGITLTYKLGNAQIQTVYTFKK